MNATEVVAKVRASVASIESRGGFGSAVVWDARGLLVTNAHVVQQGISGVTLPDGRRVTGRLVARDRWNDLALLFVDAGSLVAVDKADSRKVRVGEIVVAIGHPLGLRDAATLGVVNCLDTGTDGRELLTTDLKLAPGNSGGPVTDASGRLVGIACMIAYPGVALAVPAHVVEAFVERSLSKAA